MQPQVRDLQALIAEQTAALAPQQQLLDTSITANDASGQAQQAGLGAQKDTAFQGITQNAQNHGMFFSGFTPDQEAKYTAGTYLPALAQLQSTIANTRAQLLGKKADLNTSAYDKATAQHESDISASNSWQQAEADRQFQAAQAEKQRQFEATQNAANRAASAASKTPSMAAQKQSDAATIGQALSSVAGKDGFVSPQSFALARKEWVNAGYSANDFNSQFRNYANLTYGDTSFNNYGLKK